MYLVSVGVSLFHRLIGVGNSIVLCSSNGFHVSFASDNSFVHISGFLRTVSGGLRLADAALGGGQAVVNTILNTFCAVGFIVQRGILADLIRFEVFQVNFLCNVASQLSDSGGVGVSGNLSLICGSFIHSFGSGSAISFNLHGLIGVVNRSVQNLIGVIHRAINSFVGVGGRGVFHVIDVLTQSVSHIGNLLGGVHFRLIENDCVLRIDIGLISFFVDLILQINVSGMSGASQSVNL